MLTIDIHTHILPEHIPDFSKKFGYGNFIRLEHTHTGCAHMYKGDVFFRSVESNCWDGPERLKECKHHGVHVQVLSTVPVMFSYWAKPQDCLELSRFLNDHIAQLVASNPKQFVGLGTVPMQHPEMAVAELERCLSIGLRGIQIGSNVNQINLNDPRFYPVWAAAEKLGASIFVHPWEMMGESSVPQYWLPWLVGMPAETTRAVCSMIFGGIFEKFPALKVAFAHGGGSFPFTFGRIVHGFHCRPDLVAIDNPTSPEKYIGNIWFDSLVHNEASLRYLLDFAGKNKVALGSDYPFPLGEEVPGNLIHSMKLSPAEKASLLHGAALEWLGMQKEFFEG